MTRPAWSDEMCREFARAYDREDAAQRGEPDPWLDDPNEAFRWAESRVACVRAGLKAAVMQALREKDT